MRIFRACWYLILAGVLAHRAFPAIRPSFSLDYSSWHATDIVVVITTSVDGTFEVVESWKGDRRAGERLVIPELRPTASAVAISRYPKSWSIIAGGGISELIPREPVGSRIVLFLKRSADGHVQTRKANKTVGRRWKPSDLMDSMKASVVWIDNGRLYSFEQPVNPGPTVLSVSRHSERDVQGRVAEIRTLQTDIMAALVARDGEERAERLKPYVHSDVFPARQFALKALGKSGPSAARVIHEMLDDPGFADESAELIKALVEAGGDTVGEELNSRLRQDLAFWRSVGPSLEQDWWNEDMTPHSQLRGRYAQTHQLIIALQQTHYSAALNNVIQLRDFWRSLPQLNDPSGLNEMAKECDKFIDQLQTN